MPISQIATTNKTISKRQSIVQTLALNGTQGLTQLVQTSISVFAPSLLRNIISIRLSSQGQSGSLAKANIIARSIVEAIIISKPISITKKYGVVTQPTLVLMTGGIAKLVSFFSIQVVGHGLQTLAETFTTAQAQFVSLVTIKFKAKGLSSIQNLDTSTTTRQISKIFFINPGLISSLGKNLNRPLNVILTGIPPFAQGGQVVLGFLNAIKAKTSTLSIQEVLAIRQAKDIARIAAITLFPQTAAFNKFITSIIKTSQGFNASVARAPGKGFTYIIAQIPSAFARLSINRSIRIDENISVILNKNPNKNFSINILLALVSNRTTNRIFAIVEGISLSVVRKFGQVRTILFELTQSQVATVASRSSIVTLFTSQSQQSRIVRSINIGLLIPLILMVKTSRGVARFYFTVIDSHPSLLRGSIKFKVLTAIETISTIVNLITTIATRHKRKGHVTFWRNVN